MLSYLVIYFVILLQLVHCARFVNYTVYEVTAFNSRERAMLHYVNIKNEMIAFVNGVTNEAAIPMDVIVDGCCTTFFEEKMRDNDIEYLKIRRDTMVKNVEDLVINNKKSSYTRVPNIANEFQTWETMMQWVEYKIKKFPTLKKIKIANTYEEREIFVLKISTGKRNSAVFLMAGEDGRDWLSPAVLINFVDYILEQKFNVDLLTKHYDFYILPVLNADGHEYSKVKDWLWSRNRKIYFPKRTCSVNSTAIGINLDQNWFFSKDNMKRDEECDPVYSGSKSLSEEETAGLAKFLDSIALEMLAFINVRGFENLVTIPYGLSSKQCNNYPVLLDILSSVYDRVKEDHNRTFFYGTTAAYLYNFTGNVADWVKMKLNTPIVYTIYLKVDGYIFPSPTDIQPLTNEFATMVKEILLLASSIYSPLFNNQIRHTIQVTIIMVNIIFTLAT